MKTLIYYGKAKCKQIDNQLFITDLKDYIISETARKQTKNMVFMPDNGPKLASISPKKQRKQGK